MLLLFEINIDRPRAGEEGTNKEKRKVSRRALAKSGHVDSNQTRGGERKKKKGFKVNEHEQAPSYDVSSAI
jgi:hypothetical protein